MNRRNRVLFNGTTLLALLPLTAAAQASGQDWPQWRGPLRTGVSTESAASLEGTAETLWTKNLGLGHSSFAVADGRVFTLGYDRREGLDSVLCLDAATGEGLWRYRYPADIWNNAHDGGTLTTPTVVGDAVYTSNREGKVFCFTAADGELRWSRDLREDIELVPPTWGFSASPLVVDDNVVLNVDRVVALDRFTGDEVWVTERTFGNAYSTPTAFELGGRSYLAVLSGSGVAVLDRVDGEELAFHPWSKNPEIYPMSPVVVGDRIFVSAGYDRGCAMLRFADGELTPLWESRVMRNKMSGAVLWKDHLFGFDESILKCIDLDGNERWRERGLGTGSMTIAGGRLLILDGRGRIRVAEADPEAYVELARHEVFEDGTAWSTPVLSNGRVYCRSSLGLMTCLEFRSAAPTPASVEAVPAELPDASTLLARHVEAVGGPEAARELSSLRLTGTSKSLINTVRTGEVEVLWHREHGFRWSDDAGFALGFNASIGWDIGPRSLPTPLRGGDLAALQEVGDLRNLFDPFRGFETVEVRAQTVFEGRLCHAVDARTSEGYERTLFFDVETGRYAGRRGEGIRMWTVGAWKDFDGLLLPTEWAMFEPVKGESATIVFQEATVDPPLEEGAFAAPESLAPFLRTPEELARDTERLTKLHQAILGDWVEDANPERVTTFAIVDGFLAITEDERPPLYMSDPAANGSFVILSAPFVRFTPEKDEAGTVVAVQVTVDEDPEERLVRPAH